MLDILPDVLLVDDARSRLSSDACRGVGACCWRLRVLWADLGRGIDEGLRCVDLAATPLPSDAAMKASVLVACVEESAEMSAGALRLRLAFALPGSVTTLLPASSAFTSLPCFSKLSAFFGRPRLRGEACGSATAEPT